MKLSYKACFSIAGAALVLATFVASAMLAQTAETPARDGNVAAADKPAPRKPVVRVTISRETTWITEPLREDGYPDYLRYLNEKMSAGVTPENNAIVALAKVLGFSELEGDTRKEYFKLLGIPLPEKGNYFEPWPEFAARVPESEQPRVPTDDGRTQKEYFDQLVEIASARPWSRDEFPHIAKWIDANDRHLDSIVAASKRPRAYSPLIIVNDSAVPPILIAALLPHANEIRSVAAALRCRAMLRAGRTNTAGAIEDLLACHRLARLLASQTTLLEFFVANDIDSTARNAGIQLLARRDLSRTHLAEFRNQISALPKLPTVVQSIDGFERLACLDATCHVARYGWHSIRDLIEIISAEFDEEPPRETKEWNRLNTAILTGLVRWDQPLKIQNAWLDRLCRIAKIKQSDNRALELEQFATDLRLSTASAKVAPRISELLFSPRKFATERTSQILVALMLPALDSAVSIADRHETHRSMFDAALAIFEYRFDHKEYPASINDLIPKYLDSPPIDQFRGHALVYRTTDEGYLLYSLGKNGQDDGGKGYDEDEDADDVAIRVPWKPTRPRASK